ncbi:MAG TPA: ABC transporter permease subunit [Jiangellales bacterium]|nr:ABC transporter permease subunit [Jiangellales bacterium]
MTALLSSELRTLFRRRRTWAMLAVLAAGPVFLGLAVRLSGDEPGPGEGPVFIDRITQSGLFVSVVALAFSIPFFLPVTTAVVAGDSVAGEASLGTLRYLLTGPAGRTRLLLVKAVATLAFAVAAVGTILVVGAVLGAALFGVGPVPTLSGSTMGSAESSGRIALVGLYALVSLLGLLAVGLLVSTLTDVPVGAMAATVIVAIAAQILGSIPQLDWLHPWLLTRYWYGFADMLRDPVAWDGLRGNLMLQLGYVGVLGSLAWARFTTKDVLS